MTVFRNTDAAIAFIAAAGSRETSQEIMEAIAFFARDADEAEAVWQGEGLGRVCTLSDVWENATGNGRVDDGSLFWGGRALSIIMAAQKVA
jgi:hypothetical protein